MTDSPVLISISLAGFPPLPNETRREHWHQRAQEARTWRGAAYLVALQAIREHPYPEDFPLRRATLRLVVIRPDKRVPDRDNCIGAVKNVIDGLVDAKVMVSDRPDCVRWQDVEYEVGPKGFRIDVVMGSV